MDRTSRRTFFRKASLLPATLAALPLSGAAIAQPAGQTVFNILSFGAKGDGRTNDAPAIQRAIDACTKAGGGTVLVPAGKTFLMGSIELKSFVNLHVEPGAELRASLDQKDYRGQVLIEANGAQGISLTGQGAIDAQGRQFMREELPHIYRAKSWRPRMMVLENCRNVRLRDLTLRESALWTVHLAGCTDAVLEGLTILNDLKIPNCDGIGVDASKNVRISNCHIEAGDDCIVLKTVRSSAAYGACENVTVTGCTLTSTSAALKIGTETVNDIRHVIFSDCVVRNSSRGLAIMLRDEGNVDNVLFSNITVETRYFHSDWWGAAEPIHVTAIPRQKGKPIGKARNIRFTNIVCRSENGAFIRGSEESMPEDLLLENVKIRLERWTEWPGGKHDARPSDTAGISDHPTAGFFLQQARDVTMHRCKVEWGSAHPTFRHALEAHQVFGLENDHFRGAAARPDLPSEHVY